MCQCTKVGPNVYSKCLTKLVFFVFFRKNPAGTTSSPFKDPHSLCNKTNLAFERASPNWIHLFPIESLLDS